MFIYLRVWKGTTKKIVKLTRKIMQINHSFAHHTNVQNLQNVIFNSFDIRASLKGHL